MQVKQIVKTVGNTQAIQALAALTGTIKQNQKLDWQERDRVFASPKLQESWKTALGAGRITREKLPEENPLFSELSIAVGSALAAKIDGKSRRTYCVISDEENSQGKIWEAALIAGARKLSNLTVIIDRDNKQPGGYTENIMPLEPLTAKYEAFNWNVIEVDGCNIAHMIEALNEAKNSTKPTAIIAHT